MSSLACLWLVSHILHCPFVACHLYTGWFRRKGQCVGRWQYRSLWGKRKFILACV